MNNSRRAMVRKAHKFVEDAYALIDIACEQEDEALANMPENLERSERYEKLENNVDLLDTARDLLSDAEAVISDVLTT